MPHPSLNRAPFLPNQLQAAVDVWCAWLEPSVDVQALRCLLSADEEARAARFCLDRHALEFAFGRAMLWRILASYTDIPAERISFVYGASGKPARGENRGKRAIHSGS